MDLFSDKHIEAVNARKAKETKDHKANKDQPEQLGLMDDSVSEDKQLDDRSGAGLPVAEALKKVRKPGKVHVYVVLSRDIGEYLPVEKTSLVDKLMQIKEDDKHARIKCSTDQNGNVYIG